MSRGKITVEYDPKCSQKPYTVRFSPRGFGIDSSSDFSDSFDGCLHFIIEQFVERTNVAPNMPFFDLEFQGKFSNKDRTLLEGLVLLYNRTPELYGHLADPECFENLKEYFRHR